MHSGAHFDPQLGLDIHTYPWPLPTPHIGIVFDVFDYLPLIGTTVHVNSIKRASAGTGGIAVHIPVGGVWVPPLRAPGGPQIEDELFMGSKTVSVDGEPFSRIGMPVLSCNIIGLVPPFRLKRATKPKPLSLTLPLTFNLAIPNNVLVGGPPTINLMALLMRAGLSGLGKGFKKLKKTPKWRLFMRRFRKLRQKLFRNMDSGFLKCRVLRAEPVDIRDGSVSLEQQDFLLAGRLPLAWTRTYSSADIEVEGLCGFGWSTPADIRLDVLAEEGVAMLTKPEGMTLFAALPQNDGREHAINGLPEGSRLWRETRDGEVLWVVDQESGPQLHFNGKQGALPIGEIVDRSGNGWRFKREEGELRKIREFTHAGMTGRDILVTQERNRLHTLRLHNALDGEVTPLTRYEYDTYGQLSAEIDTLSHPRRFVYQQRRMVSHIDRNGQGFHYQYNEAWQVIHAWGDGGVWDYHFAYHALLNEVEVTDSQGAVSRITFDEHGLPVSEIDPLGGNTVFRYDDFGRTVEVTEPDGNTHRWEYDEQGRMTAEQMPDGCVIQAVYDDDGQLLALTDEKGAVWRSEYSEAGNLTREIDPTGVATSYEYDAFGQLCAANVPGISPTRYQYDRYGFPQRIEQAGAGAIQLRHSVRGTLLERIDESGGTTRFHWDMKDRLVATTDPAGGEIRVVYDREDDPVSYTDELGRTTQLRYNGSGMLTACETPDGATLSFLYDAEDRLVTVVNQNGQRWQLTRDALGRVTEEHDYWGQVTRYGWDKASRLIRREDPLGREVRYGYDKRGRLTERRSGDTLQVKYHYDPCGRMVLCENPWRRLSWRYDDAGRVLLEEQDGFQLRYGYNERGVLLKRESDSGHQVRYHLDAHERLSQIQLNDDVPILFTYDEAGRCVSEQLSNDVLRTFSFDRLGRLSTQQVLQQDLPLFASGFAYDRAGNLTLREDSLWGSDRYSYDPVGRLTAHTAPDGALRQFVQDAAGNQLQTQTHEVNDSAGGWFREGIHHGVRYVFDRAGELRQRRDIQSEGEKEDFVWDDNRQLIAVRKGDSLVRYGYDGLGRRVFKQTASETRWFYWQDDVLAGETVTKLQEPLAALSIFDTGGRLKRQKAQAKLFSEMREYVYYPDSFWPLALLTQEGGEKQSWHYHCDPNGAPVRLTSPQGEIVWSEKSGIWGEKGEVYASRIDNPLRFQGQYYDVETGLHYNRYRYYDPNIAAYISQDPVGMVAGVSVYQYAPNPLAWSDPLGLQRCLGLPSTRPPGGSRKKYNRAKGQGLYILHENGKIRYVGRGDAPTRLNAHAKTPGKSHLEQLIIFDNNLTKAEAKYLEEKLIGMHGGAKSMNPLTNLLNDIRSYRPGNKNAPTYKIAGDSSAWGKEILQDALSIIRGSI
ncbi:RHS repeat-associated core domain-containing protein [Kosakonia sacchari]|uniref:RHS repeat-associated core domain-containing protein n=1 Tax=Kosakonia sacchari TaxID=1158459 RepID=A0A1G4Z1D3_9ENTR|nr:RHS repeat-associated core domain-containing protein [Kosakonia sacchari]AIA25190.1 type IV secretion protein Rhs [Kosakonia sacchari SP1]SCX59048.1 RHS repeat-associated core domain-containing protein [Kosakonia sacchari]